MTVPGNKKPNMLIVFAVWSCVIIAFLAGLKLLIPADPAKPAAEKKVNRQTVEQAAEQEKTENKISTETAESEKQIQEDIKNGKVAALINGEPVYYEELDKGLPAGTYGPRLKKGRQMRLEQIAYFVKMKQFLKKHNIKVSPDKITSEIEDLKKNPPAMACACCRYKDISEYLELNFMTFDDLISQVEVELGFDAFIDSEWKKELEPCASPGDYCRTHWKDLSSRYAKAYHIFFNAFQDPDFRTDPETVKKRKEQEALEAWKRIQNGESFDSVARDVSEDNVSREDGGFLGYVMEGFISKEFTDALFALKENSNSRPVKTAYGVHIIRREAMNRDDKLIVLENEFKTEMYDKVMSEIDSKTVMKTFMMVRKDEDVDFVEQQ